MLKIHDVYNNPSLYSNEISILMCRIPKFLINLDSKKFFHSYIDRDFESELPDDWYGKSSYNFLSQVPSDKSYWKIDGMDFSKFL